MTTTKRTIQPPAPPPPPRPTLHLVPATPDALEGLIVALAAIIERTCVRSAPETAEQQKDVAA